MVAVQDYGPVFSRKYRIIVKDTGGRGGMQIGSVSISHINCLYCTEYPSLAFTLVLLPLAGPNSIRMTQWVEQLDHHAI